MNSGPSIAFRPYCDSDRHHLLPMLERVYDPDMRRRHELLWDWWQRRYSLTPDPDLRPTVVERDGSVAGFLGTQFRRFRIGGEERTGVFLQDSFTDPSARGVGLPLARRMLAATDVLIGSGAGRNNTLWRKLIGRLAGSEDVDVFRIRKAKRLLDPSAFLRGRRAFLARPVRWAWSLVSAGAGALAPRLRGASLEEVERFPPETDEFCRRWLEKQANAAHRDAGYLNWRFADCPVGYRKVLLRKGGELAGLAAFRVGRMNGRRVLFLAELLAAHPRLADAYGSLIGHALRQGRLAGAADAQTFDAGCPELRRALRGWGFFFRSEAIPLTGKMGSAPGDGALLYRVSDWFISAGDSDFEFTQFKQGWQDFEQAATHQATAAPLEAAHA